MLDIVLNLLLVKPNFSVIFQLILINCKTSLINIMQSFKHFGQLLCYDFVNCFLSSEVS